MQTIEDVIKALQVLKDYCNQVERCECCSLSIKGKCQMISKTVYPCDWKLIKEKWNCNG